MMAHTLFHSFILTNVILTRFYNSAISVTHIVTTYPSVILTPRIHSFIFIFFQPSNALFTDILNTSIASLFIHFSTYKIVRYIPLGSILSAVQLSQYVLFPIHPHADSIMLHATHL